MTDLAMVLLIVSGTSALLLATTLILRALGVRI